MMSNLWSDIHACYAFEFNCFHLDAFSEIEKSNWFSYVNSGTNGIAKHVDHIYFSMAPFSHLKFCKNFPKKSSGISLCDLKVPFLNY